MLYPVYVEIGDKKHAHSMVIPDFPGCFSAADDWEAIPAMVQEAVEVWMDGEEISLPKPTPLEKLAKHPDYQYGGVWMLIEIDLAKLRPARVRRVNITLPEDVLAIRNQGAGAAQIGVSGANVTYGGIVIGTFSGGTSGSNLIVTLNANATAVATRALIRNLTYSNTSDNPTSAVRPVVLTLTDGDGGARR